MKYILDTANQDEIEKYLHIIDGVTSNPILLQKEGQTPNDFLEYMQQYNIKRFIQVFSLKEFEEIYRNFESDNYELIFKVALKYPEGVNLVQQIKNLYPNAKISATMMYDIIQLNNAIELGCNYSMVYIAKNENENFLEEAIKLRDNSNSNINLVAASFRTKNDVKRAIKSGIEYSTVPPSVLEKSLINDQVELEHSNLI